MVRFNKFCLLGLLSLPSATLSFTASSVSYRQQATVGPLFSSSSLPTPDQSQFEASSLVSTPSVVHGHPLSDTHKKLNRVFVDLIRSMLFDVLYPAQTHRIPFLSSGEETEEDVMMRSYKRFYALETIARQPYFSFTFVLQLWETLGMYKQAEYYKVHFAESWNEAHHRMIMEELVGLNMAWIDEFVAQHVAVFYYWIAVVMYLINPTSAYNLNQAVEEEAFGTYDKFLKQHEEALKNTPAPDAAVAYYTGNDVYMFHAMHCRDEDHCGVDDISRSNPICKTLYDTFTNIRNDEAEHVKTMVFLQQDSTNVNKVEAEHFFFGSS